MAAAKQREELSENAGLVLETLESVLGDGPLSVKIGMSPEHPRQIEAAYNELSKYGFIKTVSSSDLSAEYQLER